MGSSTIIITTIISLIILIVVWFTFARGTNSNLSFNAPKSGYQSIGQTNTSVISSMLDPKNVYKPC
jgi:hypothetical protein